MKTEINIMGLPTLPGLVHVVMEMEASYEL
jgi:hypothetical protein